MCSQLASGWSDRSGSGSLPNSLVMSAPAKVNLFLELLHKRPDGYHEVETFMVAVTLEDRLEFREEPSGQIHLSVSGRAVPAGADNLAWRAAALVRQRAGIRRGVRISLTKRIPVGAGLGGGSSDAACVLRALNHLWKLNWTEEQLMPLAAQLGSDVPFFVTGATAAWCRGRGERVEPASLPRPLHFLVIWPGVELSTARVYGRAQLGGRRRSAQRFHQAVQRGSWLHLARAMFNRLQKPAEELCPRLKELRRFFDRYRSWGHAVSGSGSAYVVLCRDRDEAHQVHDAFWSHFRRTARDTEEVETYLVASASGGE